jgi:hypothetical protein
MKRGHVRVRFFVALAAMATVVGTALAAGTRRAQCSCTLPITGCSGVTKNCARTDICCCCPAGAGWSCDCVGINDCTTGANQCRGNPNVSAPPKGT